MNWLRGATGTGVADDCERFLRGDYVAHLRSIHERIPPWAWVNLLAHGELRDLDTEARALGVVPEGDPSASWLEARAYLAGEILDRADSSGVDVREIQQRVLVPAETRWMGSGAPMRPAELAAQVIELLRRDAEAHGRSHARWARTTSGEETR